MCVYIYIYISIYPQEQARLDKDTTGQERIKKAPSQTNTTYYHYYYYYYYSYFFCLLLLIIILTIISIIHSIIIIVIIFISFLKSETPNPNGPRARTKSYGNT